MDAFFHNGITRMFWLMLDEPKLYSELPPVLNAEIEAAAAIEALADEQGEAESCTCGQPDCPFFRK